MHDLGGDPAVVVAREAQDLAAVGRHSEEHPGRIGIEDHIDFGRRRRRDLAGSAMDMPLHPRELAFVVRNPDETKTCVARTRQRDRDR